MIDMNRVVGTHDIVLITLDTLRFDVAQAAFERGELPVLSKHLPPQGWEQRHTTGSFTYAAHHAFFAGYLPAPVAPGLHPRLFASAFRGSETTAPTTFVFDEEHLPAGLSARGYRTICIGGVGFFNQQTALGRVLPGMFQERYWSPALGVGRRDSAQRQIALAVERLRALEGLHARFPPRGLSVASGGRAPLTGRAFLFVNVSAIHAPNRVHVRGATDDSLETHAAALRCVDGALAPLFDALAARGAAFVIVCSDHGTAYGEEGHHGHRAALPCVWTVPYAHFFVGSAPC